MTAAPPRFDVDRLCALIGRRLTDEQLAAVTAPLEPTLVVAGAGSGKTTVMAARVLWLVGTGQVRPEQVLGLTFTNKAAGELAARVRATLVRSGLLHGDGEDAGEPVVATYHAYAGRLLREHGLRIGVEPGARLLADATRFQLAARVVARHDAPLRHQPASVTKVVEDVLALDGELAEHLVDPQVAREHDRRTYEQAEQWLEVNADLTKKARRKTEALRDTCLRRLELLDLVEALRAERRRLDVVDFSDQMRLAAELVRAAPQVVAAERDAARVVLLDEYQDTSVAQRVLLQTLFGDGHPVTAVGDPCQAIYGWRGASVHNIDAFPTDFPRADGAPARTLTLTVNNRSGDAVLDVANAVAEPLRSVHPAVAPLRPREDLVGTAEVVAAVLETHADEVAWVADRVAELVAAGTPPEDVAVLVRVNKEAVQHRAALLERGIPVEVVGLGGLLDVPEVADVVATLEVLDDPTANAALVRLLAGPRWQVGVRDLALLGRRAAALARVHDGRVDDEDLDDEQRLAAALEQAVAEVDPADVVALSDALEDPGPLPYSPEARERFAALADELAALRRRTGGPVADLVAAVVERSGLDVEVAARVHGDGGTALAQLAQEAAQFSDPDGESGLHAFLAYLRAARRHDSGLEPPPIVASSAVRLMTAHKAKGLEFPVVFVPALSDGVFPDKKGRPSWVGSPRCVPGALRGDAADRPALSGFTADDHAEHAAAEAAAAELEERRLAYVAFTRAQRLLHVSGHWWGPTQVKPRGPSPYLLTALEVCRDPGHRGSSVAVEAQAPAPGATNPQADEGRVVPWPAPLDPVALDRRRTVAAAVEAVIARRRAGEQAGPPAVPDGLTAEEHDLVASWDRDAAVLLTEARALAGRPSRDLPVPASLGATTTLRLLRDPAAVAAELARPMPRPPAPAATLGTRFHAWVEERFGHGQLALDDLVGGAAGRGADLDADPLESGLDDEPAARRLLGDLAEPEPDPDLDALVQAFLAGPFADRRPARTEAPFSLVLDGLVVRGRIDAVYRGDDPAHDWLVVDWKTGRGRPDPWQLAVYRLAWSELTGTPLDRVAAAFYVVPTGEVVRPGELPDRAALEQHVRALRG